MSDDEKAILKVFENYGASISEGDLDRWMAIWDAEGIQMPPDDPAFFGTEQIRQRNKQYFDKYDWSMTVDPKEVRVYGDIAFGRGFYTATLVPKEPGENLFIDGKFLTILKRQNNGDWKFFRDCFNSNVPESA